MHTNSTFSGSMANMSDTVTGEAALRDGSKTREAELKGSAAIEEEELAAGDMVYPMLPECVRRVPLMYLMERSEPVLRTGGEPRRDGG